MREDMYELIIERPRWGSRMDYPRRSRRADPKVTTKRDPDALPAKLGMKRGAWKSRFAKSLNENLAPLRRYLERQVNRPWDKVWSEICANLESGNTVQQHVRDHVEDFVAYRTFMRDGTIYLAARRGAPYKLGDGWPPLYVDPRTGILRKNKHYKSWNRLHRERRAQEARERPTPMREIAPDTQVHKFEDHSWWEVKLARFPTGTRTRVDKDGTHRTYGVTEPYTDVVVAAGFADGPLEELYGRWGVYAVSKRQLSKKEIAALGLNPPPSPIPQPVR